MKEVVFIQSNKARWKKFEELLRQDQRIASDELSSLFIQLTDDLSWARTYYPGSSTEDYLNQLAQEAHARIYKNKKVKRGSLLKFFRKEYPLVVFQSFPQMGWSAVIFLTALTIGLVSVMHDDGFARLIMGDRYINMTLANIEKGDPLAVYKQMLGTDMFLAISFNNILVALMAFVNGIFIGIGTAWAIFKNGVMVGAFTGFLVQKGVPAATILSVWVHGTLELFAIVVAGGAGLIIGGSILFPGTFSRAHSFRNGVQQGLKLASGLIPVFITAALLEGFVTRYTNMPVPFKLLIIFISALFILYYFFYYPVKIHRKHTLKI